MDDWQPEILLASIDAHMFPPLTRKGVEFYTWYFRTYRPQEPRYTSADLRDMADDLAATHPEARTIDHLVEWIQRQPISDASGVRDAIQTQIAAARRGRSSVPEHCPACQAVRLCLLALAESMDRTP